MPAPLSAGDLVDIESFISSNVNVHAASLARHAQRHALESASDHIDVDPTGLSPGDTLVWSGTKWVPAGTARSTTSAFLLMGACA